MVIKYTNMTQIWYCHFNYALLRLSSWLVFRTNFAQLKINKFGSHSIKRSCFALFSLLKTGINIIKWFRKRFNFTFPFQTAALRYLMIICYILRRLISFPVCWNFVFWQELPSTLCGPMLPTPAPKTRRKPDAEVHILTYQMYLST